MFKVKGMLTAFAALLALPVSAATVSLQPTVASVGEGATFSVDLVLDATDAPVTSGFDFKGQGFVTVTFDQTKVAFNSFSFNSPAVQLGAITTGAGSVAFGVNDSSAAQTIGTFSFTALAPAGNTIGFTVADSVPVLGSFVNTNPTIVPYTPDFIGGEVNVVPIPAAAWLMLSGLGVLGGWSRFKRA